MPHHKFSTPGLARKMGKGRHKELERRTSQIEERRKNVKNTCTQKTEENIKIIEKSKICFCSLTKSVQTTKRLLCCPVCWVMPTVWSLWCQCPAIVKYGGMDLYVSLRWPQNFESPFYVFVCHGLTI